MASHRWLHNRGWSFRRMRPRIGSVTLGVGGPRLPHTIVSPPVRVVSVRAVGVGFAVLHYEVPRRDDV